MPIKHPSEPEPLSQNGYMKHDEETKMLPPKIRGEYRTESSRIHVKVRPRGGVGRSGVEEYES